MGGLQISAKRTLEKVAPEWDVLADVAGRAVAFQQRLRVDSVVHTVTSRYDPDFSGYAAWRHAGPYATKAANASIQCKREPL